MIEDLKFKGRMDPPVSNVDTPIEVQILYKPWWHAFQSLEVLVPVQDTVLKIRPRRLRDSSSE